MIEKPVDLHTLSYIFPIEILQTSYGNIDVVCFIAETVIDQEPICYTFFGIPNTEFPFPFFHKVLPSELVIKDKQILSQDKHWFTPIQTPNLTDLEFTFILERLEKTYN